MVGEVLYRNRKPRFRAARRRGLKEQGITPVNRQEAWYVRPSALPAIPDEILKVAIPGLGPASGGVWLGPRAAKRLMAIDRGWHEVTKTEFKRCPLCSRPTVAAEAEKLRKQMESAPNGRSLPCGPKCEEERASGFWTKIACKYPRRA